MTKHKYVTSKQLKDQQREIKKSYRWWKEIELKCSICKREFTVNTTRPEMYTKEVRDNITCAFCTKKEEK